MKRNDNMCPVLFVFDIVCKACESEINVGQRYNLKPLVADCN